MPVRFSASDTYPCVVKTPAIPVALLGRDASPNFRKHRSIIQFVGSVPSEDPNGSSMIARTAMIQNLQILRLLAALWVALLHSRVDLLVPVAWSPALSPFLQGFFSLGYVGVDVFFVLSGVVMAEATRSASPELRASFVFLGMRLARIYAGWWPWFLIYLLGASAWGWPLSTEYLAASFWLAPLPEIRQYLLPVLWSLSFELYFYAVIACLLPLPRHWMRAGLVTWGLAIAGLTLWHWIQGHFSAAFATNVGMEQRFWGSPLVLEFIGGFLLCEVVRRPGGLRDWRPWAVATLVLGGIAWWYSKTYDLTPPERVLFWGSAACSLVGWALTAPPWPGRVGRWLSAGGDFSYAIYLGHVGVLMCFYGMLPSVPPVDSAVAGSVLVLALCLVVMVAWAWYHGLERALYQAARGRIKALGR